MGFQASYRQDGLVNALTGIGGQQDKTRSTTYLPSSWIDDYTLTSLWSSNGVAAKICSLQIDDMIRAWIEIPDDKDGKLLKELDRLNVRESLQRLLYWTDLYRGGIAVLILGNTGQDLKAPLSKAQETAPLVKIAVYPATRKAIGNTSSDMVLDPTSPYFGELEIYKVQPPDTATGFEVHASRCIVSKGTPIPPDAELDWEYRYWGVSRLQRVWDALGNYDVTHNAFGNLMHQLTVGKITIDGLREILSNEEEAPARLKALMDSVQASMSYLNAILMGPNEKFERENISVAGWRDVASIMREALATVSHYPTSRLFETATSGGLSAGTSETEATSRYETTVQVRQETDLRPMLARIIQHVAPMVGMDPETAFKFRPLKEPTAKETAEIRKIHADTDAVRITAGIIFPDEARSRLEGDTYSEEVVLKPEYADRIAEEDAEAAKELEAAEKAAAKAANVATEPKPLAMPKPPTRKAK
jgi:phage-related protein (TIGR01555 family)